MVSEKGTNTFTEKYNNLVNLTFDDCSGNINIDVSKNKDN